MNPYTGHLVAIEERDRRLAKTYEMLESELLKSEAEAALAGKPETYINLRERSPLADWAKKKRKEKIAAKSRRRNRS